MIQIIKKHFVNAEIECHGLNSYFENIDYFLSKVIINCQAKMFI